MLKAIKAAESADHLLKQQGVLPKGVKSRNDISTLANEKPQTEVIKDINSDVFVQKSFVSSKSKKEEASVETIEPSETKETNLVDIDENSIFHASVSNLLVSLLKKIIKILYSVSLA